MIHNHPEALAIARPWRFAISLWLLGTIASSTSIAADATIVGMEDSSRSLQSSSISTTTDLVVELEALPSISEAYRCIPPQEIKLIHEDPNDPRLPWANGDSGAIQKECYLQQNSCGAATAPSACCRVSFEAGWLVCDAYNAFDFMPCVCNDNTFGSPTRAPSTAPPTTRAPTNPPTTRAPTNPPTTQAPTNPPTFPPTFPPTNLPTARVLPTPNPTLPPTEPPPTAKPTGMPTVSPVADPTAKPTGMPTGLPTGSPPGYTTEDKFDAELEAMIRQSQCREDPPVLQFVQAATFVYRYEVTSLGGTDETSSATSAFENLEDVSASWKDNLHDELAREFLICNGYDYNTVWILQSKPHVVDESTPCGSDNSAETTSGGELPNDQDSNDFASCVSMMAEARIIAYQSPLGQKTEKQLWTESSYGEGATADQFAQDAVAFLEDRLNSGDGGLGFAPEFGISFSGGEILPVETGDGSGSDTDTDSDSGSDTDSSGTTDETSGTTTDQTTGDESLTTGTSGGGTNLWSDTGSGTAVGIEASNANTNTSNGFRLTPAMIATIAAVAACVLLLVVLAAISRSRRNSRELREDEEYLQDVTTPRSDAKHYSTHPVDHLDLSDSDSEEDSEGNDVEGGKTKSPVRTAPSPVGISSPSHAHRGRKFREAAAKKTSPLSPLHFNFSGFSGMVTSPTARERSKMGPLGLADQFREQTSTSEKMDDSATGTHRGIVSNSSSMSSTNHRGIVSNSSSMSSNAQGLPPPHQNSSPRLYQLRDTVKL